MAKSKKSKKNKDTKDKDTKTVTKKKIKTKKKVAPVSFSVNQIVKFAGYTEQPEDPLFEAGESLVIVAIEDRDDGVVLTCIKEGSKIAYDKNPEEVDGEELIASEVKIVKRGKGIAKVEEPVEVHNVGSMTKIMKKGDPTDIAKDLYQNAHESFFYLGGVLAHIFHEKLFVGDFPGDDGWNDYCEENFGFKGRKGRYYVDMYMTYSVLEPDVSKLRDIGWSKAAEIARYVTKDNVEELIERAEKTPIRELRETLKKEYTTEGRTPSGKAASRGGSKIKKHSYSFSVFEDQAEGITLVLDKAQKELGLDDVNRVFEHIIMEWAADHLGESSVKKAKSATNKKRRELKKQGVALPEAA